LPRLQQHYNKHIFKWETEDAMKEEIDFEGVEFVDNSNILELIQKV